MDTKANRKVGIFMKDNIKEYKVTRERKMMITLMKYIQMFLSNKTEQSIHKSVSTVKISIHLPKIFQIVIYHLVIVAIT